MEDQLVKFLKEFRQVQPEAGFIKRSRLALTNLPPQKVTNPVRAGVMEALESFKFGIALSFAAVMLFLIAGGISYLKLKSVPGLLGSIREQDLQQESDFSIQLGEVKYFEQSAEQVAAALNKISSDDKKKNEDEKLILNSLIL